MQNSLDYRSTRPEDIVELKRPVLRHASLEVELALGEDELVYEDATDHDGEVIELVADLDDPWFAKEGDDVDDGHYTWSPTHSYRWPLAVGLSAIAAVAAAIVL